MYFSSWVLLGFALLLSCGRHQTKIREQKDPPSRLNLVLSPLLLRSEPTLRSLNCLLVLVTYADDDFAVGEAPRLCTLSDGTVFPVHAERSVTVLADGPTSTTMELKKLPSTLRLFAMDSDELAARDELCSNQSITALPEIPLYRVAQSAGLIAAEATSVALLVALSQELGNLPRLLQCI